MMKRYFPSLLITMDESILFLLHSHNFHIIETFCNSSLSSIIHLHSILMYLWILLYIFIEYFSSDSCKVGCLMDPPLVIYSNGSCISESLASWVSVVLVTRIGSVSLPFAPRPVFLTFHSTSQLRITFVSLSYRISVLGLRARLPAHSGIKGNTTSSLHLTSGYPIWGVTTYMLVRIPWLWLCWPNHSIYITSSFLLTKNGGGGNKLAFHKFIDIGYLYL